MTSFGYDEIERFDALEMTVITKLPRTSPTPTIAGDLTGGTVSCVAQVTALLIEDDAQIARLIAADLRDIQIGVDWASHGHQGLSRFETHRPSLLILDLNLPDMDGLEICAQIRRRNRITPILMLTARATHRDIVRGLELGADDYLTKPFDTLELIARIRALLRRVDAHRAHADSRYEVQIDPPIRRGTLVIDPSTREVRIDSNEIELTAKEFDLLLLFARHPGRAFTRDELLRRLWGDGFEGFDHTVNTHINRLRSKIERDIRHPTFIETAWGVGYRFAPQTDP